MMRREFIAGLGSAVAWPVVARAQRIRRVSVLMAGTATESPEQAYLAAFLQGLRQTGWTDGQNVEAVVRWNAGDAALARI
jgi:putative ABC transport system substrate-binding protein